ncbi:MAG: exodeoxyribonuclease V subunit gamma, partial [Psychrobacter sp.]
MFTIIQSHRTENLVDQLLVQYQSKDQPVFEPFIVIVPSMVLGDWLDKTIASRAGISTLVRTKFWGQYQWTLMQDVLTRHNAYLLAQNPEATTLNVPEVAVLSPTVMQWRLFGYLTYYQESIVADEKHPVHPLLASLIDDPQASAQQDSLQQDKAQQDARIWQLASDLARVFNRYLTHREDWLALWSQNKPLNVSELIADKDALSLRFDKYARGTPEWLVDHYVELEIAQRFLWSHLFADVHLHRVALERAFWSALKGNKANERDQLPKVLRIFTIQQLPQTELDFLQNLSQYMNITLLHYNPSKLFWADIVDKSWLQRQQIINPESVFLRDYGHSLLSRLGKQSRDAFAMLANLSGNEQYDDALVEWQDNFDKGVDNVLGHYDYESIDAADDAVSTQDTQGNLSLLKRLQNDVLMLDEQSTQQATAATVSQAVSKQIESSFDGDKPATAWYEDEALENKRFEKDRFWAISSQDNSLSIHSCHSLQRQLEVLRIMIGRWLNEPIKLGEKKRHISDIVVLLPDVERHHALIGSIFVNGKGQDGLTLPAKVTGVVDADIRQLWEAIIGFYKLLGSHSARFEAAEVLDWLMLPPLFESFG